MCRLLDSNEVCFMYGDLYITAGRNAVKVGQIIETEERRSLKLDRGAVGVEVSQGRITVGYRDRVEVYDQRSLEKEKEISLDRDHDILTWFYKDCRVYIAAREGDKSKVFKINTSNEIPLIEAEEVFNSHVVGISQFDPFVLLRFVSYIVIYNEVNQSYLPPIQFDTPFYAEIKQKLSEDILQFIGDGEIITRHQVILDAYILKPSSSLDLLDSMSSLYCVCLTETNLILCRQDFSGSIEILFNKTHDALSLPSPRCFLTNYQSQPEICTHLNTRYTLIYTVKHSHNLALNKGFVDWRNHCLEVRLINNYLTT